MRHRISTAMDAAHRVLTEVVGNASAECVDIAVAGGLPVELRSRSERLELRPFGALGVDATRALEAELLADAPASVLLDLTHLDATAPAALRRLVERQQREHRGGRELLLRITPAQASALATSAVGAP